MGRFSQLGEGRKGFFEGVYTFLAAYELIVFLVGISLSGILVDFHGWAEFPGEMPYKYICISLGFWILTLLMLFLMFTYESKWSFLIFISQGGLCVASVFLYQYLHGWKESHSYQDLARILPYVGCGGKYSGFQLHRFVSLSKTHLAAAFAFGLGGVVGLVNAVVVYLGVSVRGINNLMTPIRERRRQRRNARQPPVNPA